MSSDLNSAQLHRRRHSQKKEGLIITPPESHASCMVCGKGQSLKLQFQSSGENSVTAMIQAKAQWQGFAGVVHGGMVSTLLDAAMTHCLFTRGVEAMTASLKVRFLAPVRCTDLLKITATFTKQRRHVYFLDAELTSPGKVLARAEASFVRRINTLQIQDDSMECPVNLA